MKDSHKRLRHLAKSVLPQALVNWIKSIPAYELYGMKNSSLGDPFPEVRFPAGAVPSGADFIPFRSGGRTAVFAMYSGDGRIPRATLYYLKGLSAIVDNIVLVGDCPIFPSELDKVRPLVNHCEFARHGEYDFGSYKRGWLYIRASPELNSSKELVLCNDSCYGPVVPFDCVFEKMRSSGSDFWGICGNDFYKSHIQTYFIVLRERVLRSSALDDFFSRVKRERAVMDVILRYEIGLTKALVDSGFSGAACFKKPLGSPKGENPTLYPVHLIEQGCPLLKVKAVYDEECNLDGVERTLEFLKSRNPDLYELLPKSR